MSPPPQIEQDGKADYILNKKVFWSDGQATRGKYVPAWKEWFTPRIIDSLTTQGDLPGANFQQLMDQPELYYSIEAYCADGSGVGNLGFFVPAETLPVKLGADSFWIKVRTELAWDASNYDLALLKFYRQDGVDKYSSVVVPLAEAMAGRLITPRDEALHAPELFGMLQGSGNGPDRIGLAGTWKAIAVPHVSSQNTDPVQGDGGVQINQLWLVAAVAPVPAPQQPTLDFVETHNQVARALVAKDYDQLNQYLHPDCGIFKVISPGAMEWSANAEQFTPEFVGYEFEAVQSSFTDPELWYMPPAFVCRTDDWTKDGAVMANITNYSKLSHLQKFLAEVEEVPADAEYLKKLQRCEGLISMSVTNTEDSVTLSYGLVDGQWRLIVVDLTTACDA